MRLSLAAKSVYIDRMIPALVRDHRKKRREWRQSRGRNGVKPDRTAFGSGDAGHTGARLQGLEQFQVRASAGGVSYCIAGPKPYHLEFANDVDVICLLLGDIVSRSRFEDDREADLVFQGETAAFHPREGRVRVRAEQVRHGFIAFGYSSAFQDLTDDTGIEALRRAGTRNNVRRGEIRHLARYVRERIRARQRLEPLEVQSLATLIYVNTLRSLDAAREDGGIRLSDEEFQRICDFIDAELAGEISCESIALAAGLPLRVVFDGMKARTGMSPYRFVIERRLSRARRMLLDSELPISDIAFACGFSSQQHLTSTMSAKLGETPRRLRDLGMAGEI